MSAVKEYRLDFCTIYHRDDGITIIEINDGVNLDGNMAKELTDLKIRVLGDRPLALLSNRKNSYSFTFEALFTLANLPNLIGLAIVIYNPQSRLLVETQNIFLSTMNKVPVKIYTNILDAEKWLKAILEEHTINQTYASHSK